MGGVSEYVVGITGIFQMKVEGLELKCLRGQAGVPAKE